MKNLILFSCLLLLSSCKDTDGDGIYDRNDKCKEVAGLEEFDGCPDTDNDGIIDSEDDCPNERGNEDMNGCPDADADGIQDSEDQCPDEFGEEDMNGCPDADEDGIKDSEDECPYEYGYGIYNGCPDRGSIRLSLNDCFEALSMTNSEIRKYCNTFNTNRNDIITFEACELIAEYVSNVQRPVAEGYVNGGSSRIKDGNVLCQTRIITKNGTNYLLIVSGDKATEMGTAQFNEYDDNWQTVYIKKGPYETTYRGYRMRIVERGGSLDYLNDQWDKYCGFY